MNSNRDYSLKQRHNELSKLEGPIEDMVGALLDAHRKYRARARGKSDKGKLELAGTALDILDNLAKDWKAYAAAKQAFEKEFDEIHPPNAAHRFVSWGS